MGEKWPRILPKVATSTLLLGSFTCRKTRHGTDGFTSPPKEGVLRIFRPKNPTASAWFEPANLGTKGQHATSRPPKPQWRISCNNYVKKGFFSQFQVVWLLCGKNEEIYGKVQSAHSMIWPLFYEISLRMQLKAFESWVLFLAKRAALWFLIVLQAPDINNCVNCGNGQLGLYCLLIGFHSCCLKILVVWCLTLILLTWRIWWVPNNANKWQMGFNSTFKALIVLGLLSKAHISSAYNET
jgi:hypothetical protein